VIGGTVTGSGCYKPWPVVPSSCANFDGPYVVGKITVTVTWTTTGPPIATTPIVYKNNPATASGSHRHHRSARPPGTGDEVRIVHRPATNNTTEIATDLPAPPCGPGPFSELPHPRGFVLV